MYLEITLPYSRYYSGYLYQHQWQFLRANHLKNLEKDQVQTLKDLQEILNLDHYPSCYLDRMDQK